MKQPDIHQHMSKLEKQIMREEQTWDNVPDIDINPQACSCTGDMLILKGSRKEPTFGELVKLYKCRDCGTRHTHVEPLDESYMA